MAEEAKPLSGPDLEKGVAWSDLAEGTPLLGHAQGEAIVLVRRGETAFAIGATCTHYSGPLAEGLVVDDTLRCPWHHACFSLRTGEPVRAPALNPVSCWRVERAEGRVRVSGKREDAIPPRTPARAPGSVVIVGGGPAGAACAEMLRREGYKGPVTLIAPEPPGPVDRPNLSKDYLAGNAPEEWIPLRGEDFYASQDIELVASDPVDRLDPAARTVTLKSGRKLSYGALLLATGAEPRRLNVPGADRPHVLLLRTLADSRAIIERAASAGRAVILGASFIGLEAAAALRARGLDVDVVGPEAIPLARVLGDEIGREVQRIHEQHGVRFHLEKSPRAIHEDAVELGDGTRLPAGLVVMGVGVAPRTSLAEAAGLRVENGIVVDANLRTGAADVYAAGDVARYPDARTGELVRIEHFVLAERHGQHAARSILGAGGAFRDAPFFWSQHYDVTLAYVGHATSWDRIEIRGDVAARDFAAFYLKGGRVLAVVTAGRDQTSLQAEAAMERGDEEALAGLMQGTYIA
jgi:NADPH-dependent 2,4-dienoyl-CoA reductase/sulfur reductase-like enzyme/nitrite reductase/ring-hydroxylating ferredoxin subunit